MKKRIRKLLRLSAAERWLFFKAALLLGIIRLGLWLLPFQTLRRLLERLAEMSAQSQSAGSISKAKLVQAVERAGHYVPASTCLTLALTAQVLLVRQGYPAILRIGVVKGNENQLEAHAWVESEGEAVIGGFELERYTPLVGLKVEIPRQDRNAG